MSVTEFSEAVPKEAAPDDDRADGQFHWALICHDSLPLALPAAWSFGGIAAAWSTLAVGAGLVMGCLLPLLF